MKIYVLIEHTDGVEKFARICVGESNLRNAVEKAIFGEYRNNKDQYEMVDAYLSELKEKWEISFEGDPSLGLAELIESEGN